MTTSMNGASIVGKLILVFASIQTLVTVHPSTQLNPQRLPRAYEKINKMKIVHKNKQFVGVQ